MKQAVSRVVEGPNDNQLRDQQGDVHGSIRFEDQDTIAKVIFAMNDKPPSTTESYHGWLFDPATYEYRYAGAFYEVGQGSFGLVYSTEENIRRFSEAVISLETHPQPGAPTTIILGASKGEPPQ